MKCRYLFLITVAVIVVLCNSEGCTEKEPESSLNKCTRYACPVHSDKTSTTQIKCPECNTLMVAVSDSFKKDSLTHFVK